MTPPELAQTNEPWSTGPMVKDGCGQGMTTNNRALSNMLCQCLLLKVSDFPNHHNGYDDSH